MVWKIVLQIIAVLTAIIIANLDYLWHDKRTVKFKRTRLFLYFLAFITLILSVVVTIQDNRQHVYEVEQLTSTLDKLHKETSTFRTESKDTGKEQQSQMAMLIEGNKKLQDSLTPFQDLASKRYPGLEGKEALEKLKTDITAVENRATELENTFNSIPEYGLEAKTDFYGFDETIPNGMGVTKFYKWSGEYIKENGDKTYTSDCSDRAINHYKSIIEKYPNYPFPYIIIGQCYKSKYNIEWIAYIKNAQEILRRTTKIPFHAMSHDQALELTNNLLSHLENKSIN